MKALLILRPGGTLHIGQTTAPARDMRAGGLRHQSRSVAAEACASTMTLTVVPLSLAALTASSAPSASARSRILARPRWLGRDWVTSKPVPSSLMAMARHPWLRRRPLREWRGRV